MAQLITVLTISASILIELAITRKLFAICYRKEG